MTKFQSSSTVRLLSASVVLFAINASVAWPLFTLEYPRNLFSIEGAYVGLSRLIEGHWHDLGWFPFWYCGIPFQNSCPPLLHFLVAAFAQATSVSAALAYHAVTAFLYCLGPLTFLWLAVRLGASLRFAFGGGLLYSLVSPSAVLISQVRNDLGGWFLARRLQTLFYYGEGPHIAALTLLPVAVLLAAVALEKRKPLWYLLSAVALASVLLSNWLGGFSLAVMLAVLLVAQPLKRWKAAWLTAVGIGFWAYLLAAPWIPPSTIAAVRYNARLVAGDFHFTLRNLLYTAFLLILLGILRYVMGLFRWSPFAIFSVLSSAVFSIVALSSEWFGASLVPQPSRYQLEMEMTLCLAAVALADWAWKRHPLGRRTVIVAASTVVLATLVQTRILAHYAAREITRVDVTTTTEYKTARWFQQNAPGQRVMLTGASSFWLNAFADNPQLGGGFDQGITNRWIPDVLYQIRTGENAAARGSEIAVSLLRLYGVDWIAVGNEQYLNKPVIRNPERFSSVLQKSAVAGTNIIYRVPRKSAAPVRVIRRQYELLKTPATAIDLDAYGPYVEELENPDLPEVKFQWTGRGRARATATLETGQLLVFQISYDPGWHALVNGVELPLRKDPMGLMLLDPRCSGPCSVELVYDGGFEARLARYLCMLAWLAGIVWILRVWWIGRAAQGR